VSAAICKGKEERRGRKGEDRKGETRRGGVLMQHVQCGRKLRVWWSVVGTSGEANKTRNPTTP
jgi:hypothetical protein